METFKIRKGIYKVPNHGRVIATETLKDETLVKLYLNPDFPFIELKEGGVQLLKKEKLSDKDLSGLILRSKSLEEVDLLLQVKSNKTIDSIAETKKKSLLS